MTTYAVCHRDTVPENAARGYCITTPGGDRDILLVRDRDTLHGYVNRCPHTGVNLDWVPGRFLDRSGRYLQCATHGALFRVHDGLCVHGPCVNQSLEKVPVSMVDSMLYVEL